MKKIILITVLSFRLCAQSIETVIQQGHELGVVSIAVSPDSNFVATGSLDKSIKLWDVNSGREIRSFIGHDHQVNALAFTPDGNRLISGSSDKTVRIWDVSNPREVGSIFINYRISSIAADPKGRFFVAGGSQLERTGIHDDSLVVIDLKLLKIVKKIAANPNYTPGIGVHLSISGDGEWFAVGENDSQTRVYKISNWELKYTFQSQKKFLIAKNQFTPDNQYLIMASGGEPFKKYSLADGSLVKTYYIKADYVHGFDISPDSKTFAYSSMWELHLVAEETGTEIATSVKTKRNEISEIAFTKHSTSHLLTSSTQNIAVLWNTNPLALQKEFTGFLNLQDKGGIGSGQLYVWQNTMLPYVRIKNEMAVSPDGNSLIQTKYGAKVKHWDIASGKAIMDYTGHKKAVLCFDLSKDGKRLVTGGGDGKIILWDAEKGDSLKVIPSYYEPIFAIKFNSDETKVATCGWDGVMKVHDLQSGLLEQIIDFREGHPKGETWLNGFPAGYNLIFYPNDQYLLVSKLDKTMQMWELDSRTVVRDFIGHTGIVSSMRLSKDAMQLLTASWDGSIRIWDIGTGLIKKKITGHAGKVNVAIWDSQEKYIYSGGTDRIIKVWDPVTSKVVKTLEGHKAEITTLLFSESQKMLISHSVDGATKFWDLNTGQEFYEHIQLGDKDWLAKSPQGYFNGTDNARQFIHFVDGMKTYAVDQFFNDFYRPDLLPKIFQERGDKQKNTLQSKLQSSPPPVTKLAVIHGTNPGQAEVFVKIIDQGGGVKSLKLFHNGKNVPLVHSKINLPSGKDQFTTYKQTINLVGGENQFSCVATNNDNIESDVSSGDLFSEHVSRNSTCYLFAVGINTYKNPKMSLNYARADAEAFSKVIRNNGGPLFKDLKLHTLYDTEASKINIIKKMDELAAQINPEDVFVFYYAGHGSMVDNQFYFIPTESSRLYDAASLKTEAIEASVLQEKLKNIKALKQLIVMDACQSGASVELLATRGATEEKAIAQLSRSAGIHVMASAGSEQFAAEFTELGHGLFTYLFIKALQGHADGAPKDGKVTIYELKSYLDDQVPEFTKKMKGKPQYPYTFSRGHDFPVVLEK